MLTWKIFCAVGTIEAFRKRDDLGSICSRLSYFVASSLNVGSFVGTNSKLNETKTKRCHLCRFFCSPSVQSLEMRQKASSQNKEMHHYFSRKLREFYPSFFPKSIKTNHEKPQSLKRYQKEKKAQNKSLNSWI